MKLKRAAIVILIFILVFQAFDVIAVDSVPTKAKAAIVVEATSGRVLAGTNIDEKLPMASTTKIMTALLAIEKGQLTDIVEISENASGIEGSSIWLSVGEKMSLEDLLYGLMLSSGNDAALAIAEHIAGNIQSFVDMMNERAAELGLKNTHFANPNGLPADDHYTSAYDLAIISATAMQLEAFKTIVSTKYRTIPWEASQYDRVLKNKNKLLWSYEDANGVKTGFTKEAGRCLVAAAQRDNMQLVSVVLNSGDMWSDCADLLNFGFDNFKMYSIMESGESLGSIPVLLGTQEYIDLYSQYSFSYPMKQDEKFHKKVVLEEKLDAPVDVGQKVGYIEVFVNDESVYYQDILSDTAVVKNDYMYNLRRVLNLWMK